ncbi:Asp23/Gls24 family envelope stress response protein [Enterococcus hirae]|jgi:uncharacterized alkaline shock family protein YloU|nr:Asp23/Gls24 family envelope stress response protein [Enterococcaceae bacterium]MCI1919130.1 Asp23/Gls24 family envelope stress response protein [Enterococcaceae bacterium]MDM8213540.1 Asp23/Gls24 family envelope stress response protein [Enterococcus hirae]
MADDKNLVIEKATTSLGEIVIAPEVIEIIAGIAASEVVGVYQMQGSFSENVSEWLGRKKGTLSKGITLTNDEDGLKVDIYCYMKYGVSVPKVALEIQDKVREQVLYMTDIRLAEINVHVIDVIPEKTEVPDIDELMKIEAENE